MTRVPAGRVNGVHAPVGTVLGPKEVTRELVVVTGNDERGVTVGYHRMDEPTPDPATHSPNSIAEFRAMQIAQEGERDRLRALFAR